MRRLAAAVVGLVMGLLATAAVVLPAQAAPVTVSAYTAGSKYVGQGTNVWGAAAGAPNRPVQVQVLVNGRWPTIQSGRTSASGSYALPLSYGVTVPGTYRFRVVVTLATGPVAVSATVSLVRVPISVTAKTAGSKTVGHATNVWGTAGTGAANRSAAVQVPYGAGWATVYTGRTSGTGTYSLPLAYGVDSLGTFTYRVGVSTVIGWRYSPTVTLTRTEITLTQNQFFRVFPVGAAIDAGSVTSRSNKVGWDDLLEGMTHPDQSYCDDYYSGPVYYGDGSVGVSGKGGLRRYASPSQANSELSRVIAICGTDAFETGNVSGVRYVAVWGLGDSSYLYVGYGNVAGMFLFWPYDSTEIHPSYTKTDVPRLLRQIKAEIIRVSKTNP